MNKKILTTLCLMFLPQQVFANGNHGTEHSRIYHAFTVEADAGHARDGKATSADISGWVGGDYHRLWLRGERKTFGEYDKKTEGQALYSRNISQFWDAQIGIRHDDNTDFSSKNVNYLALGVEGLAPYFFETVAQVFLSNNGNWSARLKQEFDILLGQRFILQPFMEADLYASDVPKLNVASGLSELEFGLLARYEITRKFAPYVSARYNCKTFGTKKIARQQNERVDDMIFSVGLRLKF